MIRNRRRRTWCLAGIAFITLSFLFWRYLNLFVIVRDIGYLTRPIWDKELSPPETLIPHYYSPNLVKNSTQLCQLHGWTVRRAETASIKVIDAFIFSIELDLLEIRMKELWNVVDIFLVLEADRTFTGQSKALYLQNNLTQFDWAKSKMRHRVFSGLVSQLPPGESPFYNEARMRRQMTQWIREIASQGDVIIVSDLDEIPRHQAIQLFHTCEGYPSEVHLQMKNYLYSFDYPLPTYFNWKPHINIYSLKFGYHHGKGRSQHLLTDAGWHCSFCFRHLSDFVFKMSSYSHADRLTDPSLADLGTIQRKICNGEDIFDMYPEAYTFKALLELMGPIPSGNSVLFIPDHVVENSEKFKFLLPGGCVR